MKIVRIENGVVQEIVPYGATVPSVTHWYGQAFAATCREAPDNVEQGWAYDQNGEFSEPTPIELPDNGPTITERMATIEQENAALQTQLELMDGAFMDLLINVLPLIGTGE